MRRIGHCPLCHSEAFYRRGRVECPNSSCGGLTDSEWALRAAREAYARDRIGVDELEQRVATALTDPPRRARGRTIFR